jgi:pimeloyl-ACP methyl ester carboxylesterase
VARVSVEGVGIDYEVAGEGRPVLLLHGFPDTGACWRHQVPALVDAGFRVVVPDLRGYGGSDKPSEVEAYSVPYLAGDVLGVLDDLGIARAHVVGHDWGAALGWVLAALAADRVDQLAVLSVGHPSGFLRTLAQREKSWYMLFFQFEGVAEKWLADDDWANFRAWARHPDPEVTARIEANGSLTPALNYYRANIGPQTWSGSSSPLPRVAAATMGIWSTEDMALTEPQMTDSAAYVEGTWRYERVDGVGHWLQLEAPDRVNELLVDFLET